MIEIDETQPEPVIITEEKGDLKHAIRCTEQALQRADAPWMKRACAYRIKMLQLQLSRQQKN